MIWKAVEINFSTLAGGNFAPKHVKLPPMVVTILVDLPEHDPEVEKTFLKNPTNIHLLQEKAFAKAKEAVKDIVKKTEGADALIDQHPMDQKTVDAMVRVLTHDLDTQLSKAGTEIVEVVKKTIEYIKASKKELGNFKVNTSFKIASHGLAVAGGTAMAVASHGTLSPVAGIAALKSTVAIAQEVALLVTDCKRLGWAIKAELLELKLVMGSNSKKPALMRKVRVNGTETALQVLNGATGVEFGTLKTCREHIDLYRLKIVTLEKNCTKYSEKVYPMMDLCKQWEKKLLETKGFTPHDTEKVKNGLKSARKALDHVLQKVPDLTKGVREAWENHTRFKTSIDKLSEGVQAWTQYVGTATSAIVDIGLAVGDPTSALETALSVMMTVSDEVMSFAAQ